MVDAPFALAFTAGMIATVNPCGFAMLPAYLSYFLGIEQDTASTPTMATMRALRVTAAVSSGFLGLFAAAGSIVSWTSFSVGEISPWLTIGIGVTLVVTGVAFIAGWQPKLGLPRLDKKGAGRSLWSMFVFGVSYAVASLSCTVGPFVAVVATTFSRSSIASGMLTFGAYGVGMSLLLGVITVGLVMARGALVRHLRAVLPHVHRASGFVMALMGAYLAWYGVYEIRLIAQGQASPTRGPVGLMTGWSATLSDLLSRFDAPKAGLVLMLVLLLAMLVSLLWTADRDSNPADDQPNPSAQAQAEHDAAASDARSLDDDVDTAGLLTGVSNSPSSQGPCP